jgi:hypothetical protein
VLLALRPPLIGGTDDGVDLADEIRMPAQMLVGVGERGQPGGVGVAEGTAEPVHVGGGRRAEVVQDRVLPGTAPQGPPRPTTRPCPVPAPPRLTSRNPPGYR